MQFPDEANQVDFEVLYEKEHLLNRINQLDLL